MAWTYRQRTATTTRSSKACGLRSTELCGIDLGDVDFAHRHINVKDAKTNAGIRKVDLSPMLLDDLLAWRASLCDPALESPSLRRARGSA